jgi:hypothetical protein
MLCDCREIEHIARLETPAAVIDFLCNDLGGCLKRDTVSTHLVLLSRLMGDVRTNDKVDFASFRIGELQDARSLDAIAVGTSLKFDALGLRVEIRQQLGSSRKRSMS